MRTRIVQRDDIKTMPTLNGEEAAKWFSTNQHINASCAFYIVEEVIEESLVFIERAGKPGGKGILISEDLLSL